MSDGGYIGKAVENERADSDTGLLATFRHVRDEETLTSNFTALPTGADRSLTALMACASGAPQGDTASWATSMSDADWQRFVSLALAHQLAPLAYRRLRATRPGVVPPQVVEALAAAYNRTLAANVLLYDRLRRILEAFRRAGIPVLLLKGAVFAQTLYPSIGARPMGDLDLVIQPGELENVEAILQEFGYRPQGHGTRPREYHLRYGGEMSYGPPKSWPAIDLHWHVIFGEWMRWTTAVRDEDFWSRAQPVTIDGVTVQQLALKDSILHQIAHVAVGHGCTDMGLRVYVDLDRTIRAGASSLDWPGFVDLARRVRMTTAAYFMLELCANLLDTPVPPAVLRALRPSALRLELVGRALDYEALIQHQYVSRRRVYLLRLLLVDRPRDVVRLLFRTFFPEGEWLALRYELDSWWPRFVHRLRHPIRVLLLRGEI